jgi:hypothetical protein
MKREAAALEAIKFSTVAPAATLMLSLIITGFIVALLE